MQANITLKLDAELIREARVIAAREGTSVSQLMADLLEERIRRDRAYEKARRRAVSRLRNARDLGWSPPPSRGELHER